MSSYNHHYGKSKNDLITKFGKELGWKVETTEFTDISNVGGYQTADDTEEDVYPDPQTRYRLEVTKPGASIEETYFWFLNFLRNDLGYPMVDKIYDVFSASEASTLWGNMGQRQSIQQDKASQYLRGIGELVRTLFQIVRELRILDERLEPYKRWDTSKSADITLKGIFASLVEGGGNNPDSIYSLAQKIGFTVLPDLFFNTHVYDMDKIDDVVEKNELKNFNKVVKTILRRKLFAYINWKQKTEKELESRRKFQVQYLRQHWNTIQLYVSWIKPYLKASKRLTNRTSHIESADIISAFDTTRIEIEILAKKPISIGKKNTHYKCILATFSFKSKPNLQYKHDIQQTAVGHIGSCEVTLRSYGWHIDDIESYKKMRRDEDMDLLKSSDSHIESAFESMKDELEKYLKEAEEESSEFKAKEKEKKDKEALKAAKTTLKTKDKKKGTTILDPFIGVAKGFGELGKSFFVMPKIIMSKEDMEAAKKTVKGAPDEKNDNKIKNAIKGANIDINILYTVYKKSHQLNAW